MLILLVAITNLSCFVNISADEVLKAVKTTTNKAYGMDCLLNEYFIETIDIIIIIAIYL